MKYMILFIFSYSLEMIKQRNLKTKNKNFSFQITEIWILLKNRTHKKSLINQDLP